MSESLVVKHVSELQQLGFVQERRPQCTLEELELVSVNFVVHASENTAEKAPYHKLVRSLSQAFSKYSDTIYNTNSIQQ